MILFRLELRRGRTALILWSAALSAMLLVCMAIFPEMRGQFDVVNRLFQNLGAFTAAFGMNQINLGTAMGFYGLECGNILGICGGFFAALTGICALSKEEQEHTAEFLMTHPVSRTRIAFEKLLALCAQILMFNGFVALWGGLGFALAGEVPETSVFLKLHMAHTLLQLEIAGLCFGLSACFRRNVPGAGIGLAASMYFLNLARNLTPRAGFLRYITPYAYADTAAILQGAGPEPLPVILGLCAAVLAVAAGLFCYVRRDLSA